MVQRHAVHVQPAHRVFPPQPCAACKLERVVAPPQCNAAVWCLGIAVVLCTIVGATVPHRSSANGCAANRSNQQDTPARSQVHLPAGWNAAPQYRHPYRHLHRRRRRQNPGRYIYLSTTTTTLLVVTNSNSSVAFITCGAHQVRVSNHVVKGCRSILDGVSCPPQTELVDIVQLSGHKTQPTGPALLCLAAGGDLPQPHDAVNMQ